MNTETEPIDAKPEATDSLPAIVVTQHRIPDTGRSDIRYRAVFRGGPHDGQEVEGCRSPEDAIGKLIRSVAESLASNAEVLDFIASLFADLSVRSTDVAIARAVWVACCRKRTAPGLRIETGKAVKPHPGPECPAKRRRYSSPS